MKRKVRYFKNKNQAEFFRQRTKKKTGKWLTYPTKTRSGTWKVPVSFKKY